MYSLHTMGDLKKKLEGFLKGKAKLILILVLILVVGFILWKKIGGSKPSVQYQTAQAQSGTLVTTVNASGTIISGDSIAITTQSSGLVKDVLVKNGDSVTKGQVIADVTLDQNSQQNQSQALSSLLSAQNSVNSANAQLNTLQNTEFTANQKFINDAVARGLATDDPVYIEEDAAWLAAEANYQNQQNVIAQAQQSLNTAELAYQQISTTITAPAAGKVAGLTITSGSTIAASQSSSSSSNSNTPQTVGQVNQNGPIQAEVNLAEIDAPHVSAGDKVTMTLDAFPDDTFTGKILIVNTNGAVSSGVATYPAIIAFDAGNSQIYPNMGVTATIITKIENNVLLVPSSAVSTSGGSSTVQIMQNGKPQTVTVQIGDSNDTQTVITSGVNAGDSVVTATINTSNTPSGATTSPFSGALGGRGGAGGAVFRTGGGGGGRGG